MSTLYYSKITQLEVGVKPMEQLVKLAYHSSQDNFRYRLNNSGLDLTNEAAKIRVPRFLELLGEIKATQGIEALKKIPIFPWDQKIETWENLRESYLNGSDLLHSYASIVGTNLFSTVLGEEDKILPVLMVTVEIISVHPDAGYPRFRRNPATTKEDERKFLLRILAEAIYEIDPENPLVKESEKPTEWDKNQTSTDYKMAASKIIWGFERHKGLKIKPASTKSFWKKHADQWWSDLSESYFTEKSDNKPYEWVTYDVMIHPGWEKDLSKVLGKRIESAAHWS